MNIIMIELTAISEAIMVEFRSGKNTHISRITGLVSLFHICGVIPTPQSPISLETPRRAPISPHRALMLLHRVPISH